MFLIYMLSSLTVISAVATYNDNYFYTAMFVGSFAILRSFLLELSLCYKQQISYHRLKAKILHNFISKETKQ